jgi:endonuclease YncB( thermonuclease family)
MLKPEYKYQLVEVLKFIDADTIKARIGKDVGFNTFITWDVKLRFNKINCPEKNTLGHNEAFSFVKEWFSNPGEVIVETAKDQTFDRWIATITRNGESISDRLLEEGLAQVWKKI